MNTLASNLTKRINDGKNFTQLKKINRFHDRFLAYNIEEVPIMMHVKFPLNIMVKVVISSEGV